MATIDFEKVCDELLLVKDRLMAADMGGTAVNCRELLGLVNSALDSLGYPFLPNAEEVGDEGTGGRNGIAELSDGVLKATGCALTAMRPSDELIRRRDCINWSWDHCARTKCNYCAHDCDEYRRYK